MTAAQKDRNIAQAKQKMYLTANSIYRYLLEQDENLDTLILCNSSQVELMTTDQSLYEALGSIEDKSLINFSKLVKLLEVTDVLSYRKSMSRKRPILTDARVDDIRNKIGNIKKSGYDTAEQSNNNQGGNKNV